MERTHHLQGLLIILIVGSLAGLYLWQNQQPAVTVAIPVPSPTSGNEPRADWQVALEDQLARAGTPLATPDIGASPFVPPTLPPTATGDVIFQPVEIKGTPWPSPTPRPTDEVTLSAGPTAFPSPTGIYVAEGGQDIGYEPPPAQVPLSPHANDHFWFVRPVDASANSASLFYYTFGSDGPRDEWRVHHGIDIPNPVGEKIRAGGSGKVVFAGNGGELIDARNIDIYPSYGNVVVIEHDFSFRGKKLFTLYAHMASILVEEGQHVEAGDIIGLIGGTGDVSGPHVHMEVRVGENKYFSVYNPLLWIAPYVAHGVVAGRVVGPDGRLVEDVTVTLSQRGRVIETTTTYIKAKQLGQRRDWNVVPDPGWQENFVLGDIPEGDYIISVTLYGKRIATPITVNAGTTNFVVLGDGAAATPQPVEK